MAYVDASFLNSCDDPDEPLGNQASHVVLVTSESMLDKREGYGNLLTGKSHKIKRNVRSTFAAETLVINEASESADLKCAYLCHQANLQVIGRTEWNKQTRSIPSTLATDSESWFDLLHKMGSTPEGWRLHLNLKMIRDQLEAGVSVIWIITQLMLFDGLTKVVRDSLTAPKQFLRTVYFDLKQYGDYLKEVDELNVFENDKFKKSKSDFRRQQEAEQKADTRRAKSKSKPESKAQDDQQQGTLRLSIFAHATELTFYDAQDASNTTAHGLPTEALREESALFVGLAMATSFVTGAACAMTCKGFRRTATMESEDKLEDLTEPEESVAAETSQPRRRVRVRDVPLQAEQTYSEPEDEPERVRLLPQAKTKAQPRLSSSPELCLHPRVAWSMAGSNQFGPRIRCTLCGTLLLRSTRAGTVLEPWR